MGDPLGSWGVTDGVYFSLLEIKRPHTSRLVKLGCQPLRRNARVSLRTSTCVCEDPSHSSTIIKKYDRHPQNVDLPPILPKNKKKPYAVPLKKMQRAARQDKKLAQMGMEKPLDPPKNGLLVPELIPVAYEVLEHWKVLIRGLSQLLHVVTVYGCSKCPEIHVGPIGHNIQDCSGTGSERRRSHHSWVKGSINDVLVPIESYHLFDPFGRRIKHETRFDYDRIPAVVELCIQAGVDIPEYPSRRRTAPVRVLGKKTVGGKNAEGLQQCEKRRKTADEEVHGEGLRILLGGPRRAVGPQREALRGVQAPVEGRQARVAGRDDRRGDPPNYVWHLRDPDGPPLTSALKRFYGKAPAVVELCVQAGAEIPDSYRPMMRLDIVVPDTDEARFVA
uniref:APO domain-containing protein n=1 Tax=Ananas comosus var. bracteatus TaxID=296719 RepID=A0A6V7Q7Y2_ANACO|nr:unnamed protein product [Ananas comosus var. bracteatus]